MNLPDDNSLESMLRGTIRNPSKRFENTLSSLIEQEKRRKNRQRLWVLRPLAIAATLLLATSLFLTLSKQTDSPSSPPAVATETLDKEWIELLSLADTLSGAESLADPEARLALEYYAFNE